MRMFLLLNIFFKGSGAPHRYPGQSLCFADITGAALPVSILDGKNQKNHRIKLHKNDFLINYWDKYSACIDSKAGSFL